MWFRVIATELNMPDPNIELDLMTDIEEARKFVEKVLIKAYFDNKKKAPERYVRDSWWQVDLLNCTVF